MSDPSQLLTVEEVAKLLGLGRTNVFERIRKGEIRSVLIGRCRRISRSSLADFIANLEKLAEETRNV